jgi:hypothetical protein
MIDHWPVLWIGNRLSALHAYARTRTQIGVPGLHRAPKHSVVQKPNVAPGGRVGAIDAQGRAEKDEGRRCVRWQMGVSQGASKIGVLRRLFLET